MGDLGSKRPFLRATSKNVELHLAPCAFGKEADGVDQDVHLDRLGRVVESRVLDAELDRLDRCVGVRQEVGPGEADRLVGPLGHLAGGEGRSDHLAERGASLVVSVDCGIGSVKLSCTMPSPVVSP